MKMEKSLDEFESGLPPAQWLEEDDTAQDFDLATALQLSESIRNENHAVSCLEDANLAAALHLEEEFNNHEIAKNEQEENDLHIAIKLERHIRGECSPGDDCKDCARESARHRLEPVRVQNGSVVFTLTKDEQEMRDLQLAMQLERHIGGDCFPDNECEHCAKATTRLESTQSRNDWMMAMPAKNLPTAQPYRKALEKNVSTSNFAPLVADNVEPKRFSDGCSEKLSKSQLLLELDCNKSLDQALILRKEAESIAAKINCMEPSRRAQWNKKFHDLHNEAAKIIFSQMNKSLSASLRTRRRDIEDVEIDLHYMRYREALPRVLGVIDVARSLGRSRVLLNCGKGNRSKNGKAILHAALKSGLRNAASTLPYSIAVHSLDDAWVVVKISL